MSSRTLTLETRKAALSDAATLSRLTLQLGYDCTEVMMRQRLVRLRDDPDHAVFVASLDGGEVVGVSVDSVYTHRAWMQAPREIGGLGPLNYPLASDITHQVSKDYGVYLPDRGHALRGTFLIDPKGILRAATIHDTDVGRSVDETLREQEFERAIDGGRAGFEPGGEQAVEDLVGREQRLQRRRRRDRALDVGPEEGGLWHVGHVDLRLVDAAAQEQRQLCVAPAADAGTGMRGEVGRRRGAQARRQLPHRASRQRPARRPCVAATTRARDDLASAREQV